MPNETLRLAVVDDHFIYRRGLVDILKEWPRGQVALQAANGCEYERDCANVPRIHIALVDLHMPVRDGFQTTSWISRNQARTLVLGLTEKPTDTEVLRALRTGAHGVVCKSVCDERLLRAMDQLDRIGFHYNEWVDKSLRRKVEDELPSIRPAASRDRPAASRDRPAASRDRPAVSRDRPAVSRAYTARTRPPPSMPGHPSLVNAGTSGWTGLSEGLYTAGR